MGCGVAGDQARNLGEVTLQDSRRRTFVIGVFLARVRRVENRLLQKDDRVRMLRQDGIDDGFEVGSVIGRGGGRAGRAEFGAVGAEHD